MRGGSIHGSVLICGIPSSGLLRLSALRIAGGGVHPGRGGHEVLEAKEDQQFSRESPQLSLGEKIGSVDGADFINTSTIFLFSKRTPMEPGGLQW